MNIGKWSIDKYNFTEAEIKLTLSHFVPRQIIAGTIPTILFMR